MERREILRYVRSWFLRRIFRMFLGARSPRNLRQFAEIRSMYSCWMSAIRVSGLVFWFVELFFDTRKHPSMEVNKVLHLSVAGCSSSSVLCNSCARRAA